MADVRRAGLGYCDAMIQVIADELQSIADAVLAPYLEDRSGVEARRKAGGELVCHVDLTMEGRLRGFLRSLFPYVPIIGEESAGAAAASGGDLGGGTTWLIDPLDGTGNFLRGGADFAVMVARLYNGDAVAAWIYLPAKGVVAMAEAGSGALLNGVRIRGLPPARRPEDMAGEAHVGFLPEGLKARIAKAQARQPRRPSPRFCAGATYVGMVEGECDYALYYRTRPWDHAPGTLFVREAGGHAARFDGTPYQAGDGRSGLLVTASAENWDGLRAFLLGP